MCQRKFRTVKYKLCKFWDVFLGHPVYYTYRLILCSCMIQMLVINKTTYNESKVSSQSDGVNLLLAAHRLGRLGSSGSAAC